ncbi:hypothetical protein O1611_g3322 [Lasiodiplodia mahajangana]|uniref:Uncharacterized protein n=1 Tax=Lasiodiplodia mahajangana TaxID=1108764 RepID=A0ACC2JS50_9PEZI|nr:hypothetical protein O1611_g3322 [Lasiodiplodia mahajangana]
MDVPHETERPVPALSGYGADTGQSSLADEEFNDGSNLGGEVLLDGSSPDAIDSNSWFDDWIALTDDHPFTSALPLLSPIGDGNANLDQKAPSIQSSGTMDSSDTLAQGDGSHRDIVSPENADRSLPGANFEMKHSHNDKPNDTGTPYKQAACQAEQVAQSNPNEIMLSGSEPQELGHEWKPVVRKTLIPGCAVYAPSERKHQRDPGLQNSSHPNRSSKARKKAGQCSGSFPCERCISLKGWHSSCARATFCKDTAFNNGLYQARALILLRNIKRWHPNSAHPAIDLEVGVGFPPALSIEVNAFEAIDSKLLQHVNFRSSVSSFLRTTETRPFGLYNFIVKNAALDAFFDELVPHLLEDQFKAMPSGFSKQVFKTVYHFSLDHNRAESPMLKNILRVWAAQTIFFGRIWRLSEGGERVGAIMHTEINAYDVPRFLYWQLDCITERYAYEQELAVLKDLENFIFARKSSPWLSTMVWPLTATPEALVEKNEAKARLIAGHIRTISRGESPFFKGAGGSVNANMKGESLDVKEFTDGIRDDFNALSQHLLLSEPCPFSEEDWNSLDYKFSRMIINTTD